MSARSWIGLWFGVLLISPALGQTPGMVGFQGLIKDAGGIPITGTVDLEFRIFTASSGGTLVDMDGDGTPGEDVFGQDAKQVLNVSASEGIVATKFGPVHPTAFNAAGDERWLEVKVDGVVLSRVEMVTPPGIAHQVNRPGSGEPIIEKSDDPAKFSFRVPGSARIESGLFAHFLSGLSPLEFRTADTRRMTIADDGKISIGPDLPDLAGKQLQVKGDISLEGPGARAVANTIVISPTTNTITVSNSSDPLEVVLGGSRVLRMTPPAVEGSDLAPNVIHGWKDNSVAVGKIGATISGGGNEFCFGLVCIDESNQVSDSWGTVSGGADNTTDGRYAMVPGGLSNQAGGTYSFAAGHNAKVRNPTQSGTAEGDQGTFVWADAALADFTSTGPNQFLIRANSGVGIGTNAPQADLHVNGDSLLGLLMITPDEPASGDDSEILLGEDDDGTFGMTITYDGGVNQLLIGGKSGATVFGPWLKINRNSGTIWAESSGAGTGGPALRANNTNLSGIGIFSTTNSTDANLVLTNSGTGNLMKGFSDGGSNLRFKITGTGTVTADGTITGGGADFAEMVRVSTGAQSVEPGDVMVIDRNHPRSLLKSTAARSTLVAGVYATNPGFLGSEHDWDQLERELVGSGATTSVGQATADRQGEEYPTEPTESRRFAKSIDEDPRSELQEVDASGQSIADDAGDAVAQDASASVSSPPGLSTLQIGRMIDEVPVAVVGIVPCKVSAENGPIRPGDLLVTSTIPGCAMRDENPKAGTIVGKALGSLSADTGVIKVLVTVQ